MQESILKICMKKGFLLDKEMLDSFSGLDEESAKSLIDSLSNLKIEERVITKTLFFKNIEKIKKIVGWGNKTVIENFFIKLGYSFTEVEEDCVLENGSEDNRGKVKMICCPVITPKKISVKDFINHFRAKYEQIKSFLQLKNFENLTSIRKIGDKKENYSIIAAVLNKRITKNKNLLLEVEDLTGTARVLVNNNKEDVFAKAKDLLVDDVVGFSVSGNSEWLFANDVVFPDCALGEKKKSDKEELAAFCSDLHVGSSMFLEKNVLKFFKWLNGMEGTEEQRALAKKVQYVFFTGDNVDGVGVFPSQEKLLEIKDIKQQYVKLVEMLKLIRKDIKIIMCPGQHDAVWLGQPQPIIGEDWAPGLHKMENLILVPNPALVEIDGGFKILMYHGSSMAGVINEIEDLRINDGFSTPTKVVKELLKRRHLAPIHGSVDYIPNDKKDLMVIEQIPDIVATGDLHKSEIGVHNNILLIASSCWQSMTPFEEKVGNHPDPCKVPLFNLKTREIKIMDFSDEVKGDEMEKEAELK